MKKFSVLILSLWFLVACNKDSPAHQEVQEGGITGGGGGTLPANPIAVYEVFEVIEDAKRNLRLYFNYERQYRQDNPGSYQKFFFGKETVATQLEKVDLEVLKDKPCKDKNGNDVDASVIASRPNTICLSASRVAPKLIKETAQKEILALLIHELTHFLGATEAEAVAAQQWSADRISDMSKIEREKLDLALHHVTMSTESLRYSTSNHLKSQNLDTVKKAAREVVGHLYDYKKILGDLPLAFIDFTIGNYQDVIIAKLILLEHHIDSLDPSNPNRKRSAEQIEKCFLGKDSVTVSELNENCSLTYKENIYGKLVVERVNDLKDIQELAAEVNHFIHDLGAYFRSITFNQTLAYFHLPTTIEERNPFEKFVGVYSLKKITCASSRPKGENYFSNLTGIEISNSVIDFPIEGQRVIALKRSWDTGYTTDMIYTGNSNGYVQLVGGDDSSAVVTGERGTRWYDRQSHGWSKETRKIVRDQQGNLILDLARESFLYDYRGVREESYGCRFQLLKQ